MYLFHGTYHLYIFTNIYSTTRKCMFSLPVAFSTCACPCGRRSTLFWPRNYFRLVDSIEEALVQDFYHHLEPQLRHVSLPEVESIVGRQVVHKLAQEDTAIGAVFLLRDDLPRIHDPNLVFFWQGFFLMC